MKNRKNRGMLGLFVCFIIAVFVFGTQSIINLNNEIIAAGEMTSDVKLKQFMFERSGYKAYGISTEGTLYYGTNILNYPMEKAKDSTGKYITKVEKIYANSSTGLDPIYIKMADGSFMVKGTNTNGKLGTGNDSNAVEFTPINFGVTGTIKDIHIASDNTYLIMENGDVYAAGTNSHGQLATNNYGNPANSNIFVKTSLETIDQIESLKGMEFVAKDKDGKLFTWGKDTKYNYWYSSDYKIHPMANSDGSEFSVPIKEIVSYEHMAGGYMGFTYIGMDGKIYNQYEKANGTTWNNYGVRTEANTQYIGKMMESFFSIDPSTASSIIVTEENISMVVEGILYIGGWSEEHNQYEMIPCTQQGMGNITNVKEGGVFGARGSYSYALTEDGIAYLNGNKIAIKNDISIIAKKNDDTNYGNAEKYNGDVTLNVTRSSEYASAKLYYKVKDITTGTYGPAIELPANDKISIPVSEGDHVYQEYTVYVEGKEDIKETFTVDLYNHDFEGVSVDNNKRYPVNHTLSWDETNGLIGNSVTATISMNGGAATPIKKGDALTGEGKYILSLVDEYGNSVAYSFSIANLPTPESIEFTPTTDLIYGISQTKKDGTLGTLELKYPPDKETSTIKTIEIVGGNDAGYFKVEVDPTTNETKLIAVKDVPAGTYDLTFSGTDGNDIAFENFPIEFTVKKAENVAKWNDDSLQAQKNGISIDKTITVGVVDAPEDASVAYTLKETNANVSVDPTTGVITFNGASDEVVFTVVATIGATDNVEEKVIELNLQAKKRALKLKSVIGKDKLDSITIKLGDALPTFGIASIDTLPTDVTLTDPADYTIYDSANKVVAKITKAGTYTVKPSYTNDPYGKFDVTWSYASIVVEDITIDDSNVSDFYTLTKTDGTVYTPGEWTKQNVIITPVHAVYHKMAIDTSSTKDGTQTISTEGDQSFNLMFESDDGIQVKTKVEHIKIDKTAPILTSITYDDVSRSMLQQVLNALTFDHYFSKAKVANFHGTDTGGSGIEKYHAKVMVINDDFEDVSSYSDKDGDSISLSVNKNYRITLVAYDAAGNESEPLIETVKIDDRVPEINIDAVLEGTSTLYEETWTSKGIDISLSSESAITSWSWYIDENDVHALSEPKLTIPNTENVDEVTYTFQGTTATGVVTTKTLVIKIDKDTPKVSMSATSGGVAYTSGATAEDDVVIHATTETENISGTTLYYCEDATTASTDPSLENGWNKWTKDITVTENGKKIFYVKAMSNAGLISQLETFTVNLQRKVYTDIQVEMTSNEKEYTSGEWTRYPIQVKLSGGIEDTTIAHGYQYAMSDGTAPDATTVWSNIEKQGDFYTLEVTQDCDKTYWFRVDAAGKTTSGHELKKDSVSPKNLDITYSDQISPVRSFLRMITFDQLFKNAQTATFTGSDDLSQIKEYHFTVDKIKEDGTVLEEGTLKTGSDTYLAGNACYKISVTAMDHAGNESTPLIEYVKINDQAPELNVEVSTNPSNEEYKEQWTSEALDVNFITDAIVSEYAWSKDGTNFTIISSSTMQIPNDENQEQVEYTFRIKDDMGEYAYKKIKVNMDIITPVFHVVMETEDGVFDGSKPAEADVTLIPTKDRENISGVTYYYTRNAEARDSDPRIDTENWIKLTTDGIVVSENGDHSLIWKSISNAGLISDPVDTNFKIQKRENTKPTITGKEVEEPYSSGDWAQEDVILTIHGGIVDESIIQGYEYTITDGNVPDETSTWKPVHKQENAYSITEPSEVEHAVYWFRVDEKGLLSDPFIVNIDRTKPVIESLELSYINDSGIEELLHAITGGKYFNKEIIVTAKGSDNFTPEDQLQLEYAEIIDGVQSDWLPYTAPLHYGDGSNLKVVVRAIDKSGRISDERISKQILLDLVPPTILGVEDQKNYYFPKTIHMEDSVSDLDLNDCWFEFDKTKTPWEKDTIVNRKGEYRVHALDHAGNDTEITFILKPLPNPEDLSDNDEDRKIVDEIEKEYEESKDSMNEEEKENAENWIEDAKEKTKKRIDELKDLSSGLIITGKDNTKFDADMELVVTDVTNEYPATKVHLEDVEGLNENSKLQEVLELELHKGSDVIPLPDGASIEVKIPYTKDRKDTDNLHIVQIDAAGKVIVIPYQVKDIGGTSYIVFETDSLDHIGIVKDVKEQWNESNINIDTNGDGLPDLNVDINGDGIPDINIDLNGDGKPELDIDVDGNGKPDLNIDTDGDGIADEMIYNVTEWTPTKKCIVDNFAYGTMEELQKIVDSLQPDDGNTDNKNDGKPDNKPDNGTEDKGDNPTGDADDTQTSNSNHRNEDDPKSTSVKGNYVQNGTGGALTGDSTTTSIFVCSLVGSFAILLTLRPRKRKR